MVPSCISFRSLGLWMLPWCPPPASRLSWGNADASLFTHLFINSVSFLSILLAKNNEVCSITFTTGRIPGKSARLELVLTFSSRLSLEHPPTAHGGWSSSLSPMKMLRRTPGRGHHRSLPVPLRAACPCPAPHGAPAFQAPCLPEQFHTTRW